MDRRDRLGPEAGTTLIEVLITVVILGVAVVAIVGSMFTSIIGTDLNRRQATARTVLASAAESVKSQSANAYQACNPTYDPTQGVALPSGWPTSTVTVTVRYWSGTGAAFQDACPATDTKLQLVTVEVKATDLKAIESVTVLKRSPA